MQPDVNTLMLAIVQGAIQAQQAAMAPTLTLQIEQLQKQLGQAGDALQTKDRALQALNEQLAAKRAEWDELASFLAKEFALPQSSEPLIKLVRDAIDPPPAEAPIAVPPVDSEGGEVA